MGEQFELQLNQPTPKTEATNNVTPATEGAEDGLHEMDETALKAEQARLLEMRARFASSDPEETHWIDARLAALETRLESLSGTH